MQQHEDGQKSLPQFECPLPIKLRYLQQLRIHNLLQLLQQPRSLCHMSIFTCISLKMTPRSLSISLWPRVEFKIMSDRISTANRKDDILPQEQVHYIHLGVGPWKKL